MRTWALVLVVAAILVGLYAAHSQAAETRSAPDRRVAQLQRQVKTLQRQVAQVTRSVKSLNFAVEGLFLGNTCALALQADLLQGTWGVIDQMAQALQSKTYFGPQQQLNDYRNCSLLLRPTVPRGPITVPPTIAPMVPMIQWMHIDVT